MASVTYRQESSSSDDELGSTLWAKVERHGKRTCMYHMFETTATLAGQKPRKVYVWLRNCSCDRGYKSYDVFKGVNGLHYEDFKDIHFKKSCRWKMKHHGNEKVLRIRKCPCKGSKYASYTGNVPYPH